MDESKLLSFHHMIESGQPSQSHKSMEFRESASRCGSHAATLTDSNTTNNNHEKETENKEKSGWRWRMITSISRLGRRSATKPIPMEFLCPISNSLMAQPVTVSSGHTFERAVVDLCRRLRFTPTLPDGAVPDFSTLIPNLALASAIHNFCAASSLLPPTPPPPHQLQAAVLAFMTAVPQQPSSPHLVCSGFTAASSTTPLPSWSFSSTSDDDDDEEMTVLVAKMRSQNTDKVEEAVGSFRRSTRSSEASRIRLCTPQLLSALKPCFVSRCPEVQASSVAALVNLSLEKVNKVKIVRSGMVPPLIGVLKSGFAEAQEHACGALFSLVLDDANKTAIGVLGALQPLLHALRFEREPARNDAASALYHLSLVHSNRTKLVKLGAVQNLLNLVKSGHLTGPILLILRNMAACPDSRATMLDAGAVGLLVSILGESNDSMSTQERCISVLYGLSHGGLRFKILAKEAGAVRKLEEFSGSERAENMVRRIIEAVMDAREENIEEDVDWEELIDLGLANRGQSCSAGSSNF